MLHGWENLNADERATIERGILDNAVYNGPHHVEISPTDNCNYDCFFCNQAFIDRSQMLPLKRLNELIDELVPMGLKMVRLSGGGEPLLHRDIKPFLDHIHSHRLPLDNVTTNGFMMDEGVTERLLKMPTKQVIISLNESDGERYAEMMKVKPRALTKVIENVKTLNDARRTMTENKPELVVQFFIWKQNFRALPRMVEMAQEMEADIIYLRTIWGLKPEERLTNEEREELRALAQPVGNRYPSSQVAIDLTNEGIHLERPLDGKPEMANEPPCGKGRDKFCYIGWYSSVIRGNGDVFPCCMLQQDPDYPGLGNVKDKPFREVWEGPGYQELRNELRSIAIQRGEVRDPSKQVRTKPICSAKDQCPLVYAMCDADFYAQMNASLDRERRSLGHFVKKALARTL